MKTIIQKLIGWRKFVMFMALAIGVVFFLSGKSSAQPVYSSSLPNVISPGAVPTDIAGFFYQYDTSPNSPCVPGANPSAPNGADPALMGWLTQSGVLNADLGSRLTGFTGTVTVPYQTQSLDFTEYNMILFCRHSPLLMDTNPPTVWDVVSNLGPIYSNGAPGNGDLSNNQMYGYAEQVPNATVSSSPSATVSGLPTTSTILMPNPNYNDRYTSSSFNFSVNFAKPLTSTTTVVLSYNIRRLQYWSNYGWECTDGSTILQDKNLYPIPYNGHYVFKDGKKELIICPMQTVTISITIYVTPQSCNPCLQYCHTLQKTCRPLKPPTPTNCSQPGAETDYEQQYAKVAVALKDLQGEAGNINAPPSTVIVSAGSAAPPTYVQATSLGYEITQAHDQYTPPTTISWSPHGLQSSNQFTLNYKNYITGWPYDPHNTTVYYQQKFSQTYYNANFTRYTCNPGPGGTLDGTTCKVSHTVYTYGTNVCSKTSGLCGCQPIGTAGGAGRCVLKTSTYYTYPAADEVYTYEVYQYVPSIWFSSTVPATPLPELCPRNFQLMGPEPAQPYTDVSSVLLTGKTPDYPQYVTINTQTSVKFYLKYWGGPNVRHPFSVSGIKYLGNYYIESASTPSSKSLDSPNKYTFQTFQGGTKAPDYVTIPYEPINNHPPIGVNPPTMNVGDQVCAEFYDSPAQGQLDWTGASSNTTGKQYSTPIPTYLSTPQQRIADMHVCSAPMENIPYARAYGNDVVAGAQFENSNSTCPTNSSITAYQWSNAVQRPIGSGSQFAAMSIGSIQDFASAFLRSIKPYSVNGLTFANSSGGYGGNFSSQCLPIFNYFKNKSNTLLTTTVTSPMDVSKLSGGQYLVQPVGGTLDLTDSSGVNNTAVLYVQGNVEISQDITYNANGAKYSATTGKVTGVPNLYVIASGNIYIQSNVQQLDGVYVAENTCDYQLACVSSGGMINTCANGTQSYLSNELFKNCNTQLTIRGALIADTIKLERTYASMRNSVSGENPLSSKTYNCSMGNLHEVNPINSKEGCASEVFNFDPLNYLGNPGIDPNAQYQYDSIYSLPPVL